MLQAERFDRGLDLLCHFRCAVVVGPSQHDPELLATIARDRVSGATRRGLDGFADLQHRDGGGISQRAPPFLAKELLQAAVVRDLGQGIDAGEAVEVLGRPLQLDRAFLELILHRSELREIRRLSGPLVGKDAGQPNERDQSDESAGRHN